MGMNLVIQGGAERAKFFPPGAMGAVPGMVSLATGMMKKKIEKANIPSLADLQEVAQIEGVPDLERSGSPDSDRGQSSDLAVGEASR